MEPTQRPGDVAMSIDELGALPSSWRNKATERAQLTYNDLLYTQWTMWTMLRQTRRSRAPQRSIAR